MSDLRHNAVIPCPECGGDIELELVLDGSQHPVELDPVETCCVPRQVAEGLALLSLDFQALWDTAAELERDEYLEARGLPPWGSLR